MASQVKPKRVLYPTELLDRRVARLQRDLRRLFRSFRRGNMARLTCLRVGEEAINKAFQEAEADIKAFLVKRGLKYEGDRSELGQGLTEALDLWRHVVDDFQKAQ